MPIIQVKGDLPNRAALDVYPTPIAYARATLKFLVKNYDVYLSSVWKGKILDPGAGTGVWGQAAREIFPDAEIHGTEIRDVPKPEYYDYWYHGDYERFASTFHDTDGHYDLIIGNPPYYVLEDFMDNSFDQLKRYGLLWFLLPSSFSESKKRYLKYFSKTDYHKPELILNSVRRISFTGNRKSNATAYAQYLWIKHTSTMNFSTVATGWLDWDYD